MKTPIEEATRTYKWLGLMSGQSRVPIAQTARTLVYSRDRIQLFKYVRETPATKPVPVLMIYSLINRPTILDLLPERSVVQQFLAAGHEVYLLDWGVPDGLDRYAGLDIYLNLHVRTAVRKTCQDAGSEKVTLFGYCMGGTMAAMYAALHPRRIHSMILLGAPFSFRSEQLLYRWGGNPATLDPDKIVDACGNAPTWAFEGFTMLKLDQKAPRAVALYDNLHRPEYVRSHLAMEQWIGENIPMAGAVYSEFIKGCFQGNRLMDSTMYIAGRRVDLSAVKCPVLLVMGEADHLVPPETTSPAAEVFPQATAIRFKSGHIGLSVSSAAHRKLWPDVLAWLALQQPQIGLIVARDTPGSVRRSCLCRGPLS